MGRCRIRDILMKMSYNKYRLFKRYLWKKSLIESVRMNMKTIASELAKTYNEDQVSEMIRLAQHRPNQNEENQATIDPVMLNQQTSRSRETEDIQVAGGREGDGALTPRQMQNSNIALNGSSVIQPSVHHCAVQGDVNITYIGSNNDTALNGLTGLTAVQQASRLKEKKEYVRQIIMKIKSRERKKNECVPEGALETQNSFLDEFYTELHIVASDHTSINNEHEVWQVEMAHLTDSSETVIVKCNDLFIDKTIRCVLTKGIAGIGKTVAMKQFVLDWADGKANQKIDIVISLPFRILNLLSKKEYSLHELLRNFHPELEHLKDMTFYSNHTSLFILDGLDETKLPLDVVNNVPMSDVTKTAPLDVLLTNLLTGHLLPSTQLWITSRPQAASRLKDIRIDQVNEIRGFNDAQKDKYFKKKIKDTKLAELVISNVKASRSLHIMCHIPMFSFMSSVVLQRLISKQNPGLKTLLPQTLTDMYIHYLTTQTLVNFRKYEQKQLPDEDRYTVMTENQETIWKLGKLANKQLMCENVVFTAKDMNECEITSDEAAKCPGMCTEFLDLEYGLYERKLYSFLHLSVQEFFAALFAFLEFANSMRTRVGKGSLLQFLKDALRKALDSKSGHLDLYVRFLFGISHDSSRDLLQGILPEMSSSSECHKKLIAHMKALKRKDLSPERCINLIHCLNELKYQITGKEFSSDKWLTPFQCTMLAYQHGMSENPKVFDFKNKRTEGGFQRLAPALRSCTTAVLSFCEVTPPVELSATVAYVIRSNQSRLSTLDLGHNNLGDAGVRRLCDGLRHQNCMVESLDLSHNGLGTGAVEALCDVLTTPTSRLLTLDLSSNDLGDQGAAFIAGALCEPQCKLHELRLSGCGIKKMRSSFLHIIQMSSHPILLKMLDLSYNPLEDFNTNDVTELNSLGVSLQVDHGGESRNKPGLEKYACDLTLDPSTANGFLSLSEEGKMVTRLRIKQESHHHDPEKFDICNQVLSKESLQQRHYLQMECVHDVHIGMAYKNIPRKGSVDEVTLGHNDYSWDLYVSREKCCVQYNKVKVDLWAPKMDSPYRIDVYLDWPAGILSYYVNNSGKLTLLYAFLTKFTDPLHLALKLNSPGATVSLKALPQIKSEPDDVHMIVSPD